MSPNDSIQKVILEISGKCLGVTAVVEDGKVVGAITDGDLRRMLEKNPDTNGLVARDIMTVNPKTIAPQTLAVEALDLMRQKHITNIFVVEDGNYLGVIHIHDILKEGLL